MMSWKQEAVELVEAALTRLQTVATRPDPDPDPNPVNELSRLVHTMGWFALSVHDSTRDLIHELQLFVDDLRMGRVSLGARRAILLRETLRLIKVDLEEASLLCRRPTSARAWWPAS